MPILSIAGIRSFLGPNGQIAVALFTLFWTVLAFLWSNLRPNAQRLGVVDLATRRLAFWDAALQLELLATSDPDLQQGARSRALDALARIRADADLDLERLSWSAKTDRKILRNRNPFSFHWPSKLARKRQIEWFFGKLLCYYFVLFAAVTMLLTFFAARRLLNLPRHPGDAAHVLMAALLSLALLGVAFFYGRAAERLTAGEPPEAPIFDRL